VAKIAVLGGCGAVGSVAVKTLASLDEFSEIVIGDLNIEKAGELVSTLGEKVSAVEVDANSLDSIKEVIKGSDVVLNCVGPFYRYGPTILRSAIDSGIDYVDLCDDVDATEKELAMGEDAKKAGILALIGMGSSPGATNLLAKFAADQLLDETDSIDIFHAHGGEPVEGEGVIAHRFHSMLTDIPMFLDGELKYVKYFGMDGIALRCIFDFPVLGKIPVYPYPHPEQMTIPMHIKVKRVTNRGTVLPNEYYDLTRDLCRLGLSSKEPIDVRGQKMVPYDFAVAYLIREREKILKETGFGTQRGCCSVVVKGKEDGKYSEYRFHMASKSQALGEGTGIPAVIGAILMHRHKISGKGVSPPEGCLDPIEFIGLVSEVMKLVEKKEGGFGGVMVDKVDEKGNVTKMDI